APSDTPYRWTSHELRSKSGARARGRLVVPVGRRGGRGERQTAGRAFVFPTGPGPRHEGRTRTERRLRGEGPPRVGDAACRAPAGLSGRRAANPRHEGAGHRRRGDPRGTDPGPPGPVPPGEGEGRPNSRHAALGGPPSG